MLRLVNKMTRHQQWQAKVNYRFISAIARIFVLATLAGPLFIIGSRAEHSTGGTVPGGNPAETITNLQNEAPQDSPGTEIYANQALGLNTEALVVDQSPTTEAIPIININEEVMDDGLCTLSTINRRSLVALGAKRDVVERGLICSGIDVYNYPRMVRNIYRRNKLSIQQIEITGSESLVVFSAIDLICDRFNCSRLTVLNITGQQIHDCGILSSRISSWPQLEILDLSNTSLTTIESISQNIGAKTTTTTNALQNLSTLLLDNNSITSLDFNYLLKWVPNLKHLSLVNNSIFDLNCDESLRSKVRGQLEVIGLAGNSLNCDKNQLWFLKQILNSNSNLKFPDYEQIRCETPEALVDMTWSQRISVLETTICDDCDCRSLKRTAISVDCHNKNLSILPDMLPINTKVLNLTSNKINTLGLPPNSRNWENVTYVYLQDNLISSFQPLESNSKFLRNLAALDIRKNRFQEFPSHIFEQFINLDQVHLSNNPWLCDCEPTFAFQEWLQRQFHKVGDKEEIMCGISGSEENGVRSLSLKQRLSSRIVYRLSKSELCPQDNLEEPLDWLDMVNFLLGITILLILIKVTLDYVYQHRTKRLPHFFKLNF